ncbi:MULTISPECIES: LPS translocon maturation chaperone LptM [Cysteiniphilum]|uniref:LPS translocon maturation chaperone LptM n=1 Tax=Cysteiniphilum TaxID=2056696 RepID=UPI0017812AC9|nr:MULTISPECIES: lipoprotein [Cysteiniphilum]
MTKRSTKLFTLLIPATLLMGCGQMGPLYLPKDDTATVAKSTETSNATKTSATAAQSADTSDNDKPSNKSVDTTNNDGKDKRSFEGNKALSSTNDQTAVDDEDIQSTDSQQDQQNAETLKNQE